VKDGGRRAADFSCPVAAAVYCTNAPQFSQVFVVNADQYATVTEDDALAFWNDHGVLIHATRHNHSSWVRGATFSWQLHQANGMGWCLKIHVYATAIAPGWQTYLYSDTEEGLLAAAIDAAGDLTRTCFASVNNIPPQAAAAPAAPAIIPPAIIILPTTSHGCVYFPTTSHGW
jgi:hypothetical protein